MQITGRFDFSAKPAEKIPPRVAEALETA
jgi:hypothetical protein